MIYAAALLALAATGWANTIDFTQMPSSPGNQGSVLNFSGLAVNAKTGVNTNYDPWAKGVDGNVYWGNLGTLGALNSTTTTTTTAANGTVTTKVITKKNLPELSSANYTGAGALKTSDLIADSSTGPITYHESLVFNFDKAQEAAKLSFTLLGVNGGYLETTTTTTKTNSAGLVISSITNTTNTAADPARDEVWVFLKIASGEIVANYFNYGAVLPDGSDWNQWIVWMLNQVNYADEHIVGLAVEETYGTDGSRQFGVGSITYEVPAAVPEPTTMLLLGLGLAGLAGLSRRVKK